MKYAYHIALIRMGAKLKTQSHFVTLYTLAEIRKELFFKSKFIYNYNN